MGSSPDGLLLLYSGKGKNMWEIPGQPTLLLQEFRNSLSTHNVVHASEIPGKGELIAAQTLFMGLEVLTDTPQHLVAHGMKIYEYVPREVCPVDLHHRAFVVHKCRKPDIEYIFRDFNTGSMYKDIQEQGTDPYGHGLSPTLPRMHRFDRALFTPTEKSATDSPLRADAVGASYGAEMRVAEQVFVKARAYLAMKGITLIDAKFEVVDGLLIDDWLNGDCARMAFSAEIEEGIEPPFLDKERFRTIAQQRWGTGPRTPLTFSDDEIKTGLEGYYSAFAAITGLSISKFQRQYMDI